jgi:hypothetical protein
VLLGAWLLLAFSQRSRDLAYFHDDFALYTRAVLVAPDNPQFQMNLALEEHRLGMQDPSCSRMRRAVAAMAGKCAGNIKALRKVNIIREPRSRSVGPK